MVRSSFIFAPWSRELSLLRFFSWQDLSSVRFSCGGDASGTKMAAWESSLSECGIGVSTNRGHEPGDAQVSGDHCGDPMDHRGNG
jgi:hypothetical protein